MDSLVHIAKAPFPQRIKNSVVVEKVLLLAALFQFGKPDTLLLFCMEVEHSRLEDSKNDLHLVGRELGSFVELLQLGGASLLDKGPNQGVHELEVFFLSAFVAEDFPVSEHHPILLVFLSLGNKVDFSLVEK